MVFLSGDLKATRPIARFLNTGTVPKWADLVAFLLLAACAVAVLTYVTCIILTAALGTYTGGLRMPYFSDT